MLIPDITTKHGVTLTGSIDAATPNRTCYNYQFPEGYIALDIEHGKVSALFAVVDDNDLANVAFETEMFATPQEAADAIVDYLKDEAGVTLPSTPTPA
jgi:hypothetical protein